MLLATKCVSVFGRFRSIFGQKIDPKLTKSNFFPKRIHQKKFQLKIPIFSKSDGGATWWPNNHKKFLTCGQLRNTQRYQEYVQLIRAFFLGFRTCSSQQCDKNIPSISIGIQLTIGINAKNDSKIFMLRNR